MILLGCCFMNHADELLRFYVRKHVAVRDVNKRAAYAFAAIPTQIPNVTSLHLCIDTES